MDYDRGGLWDAPETTSTMGWPTAMKATTCNGIAQQGENPAVIDIADAYGPSRLDGERPVIPVRHADL